MQSRFWLSVAFVSAVAVPATAASFGKGVWNDGRAEVAVYESEQTVDGVVRAFREQLITVKENKTVLKFNQVQSVETSNFPRHTVVTVFVKEDEPQQLIKATLAMNDWVGSTFKVLKVSPEGSQATLLWYAPGSSDVDGNAELSLGKDDYIEDQLPLSLRALPFKDGFEKKIKFWPSLAAAGTPTSVDAVVSVGGPEDVRGRAGTLPCWTVTVKRAGVTDTYWFEKADPHLLVKMETADGRKRLLYGRARWSYWDKRLPRPNILN